MKEFIKRLLRESLYDSKDKIWYHGSNKEIIDEPRMTVSEFDGTGGFFLSESKEFAKANGDFISEWKIEDGSDIFNVRDYYDFERYAEEVIKLYKIPNLDINDYVELLGFWKRSIDDIKAIMRKAYPEIDENVDNIYNIIMDDMGLKYDNIQYLLRKRVLYDYDYIDLERNSVIIKRCGFDGIYLKESKKYNFMNVMIFDSKIIKKIV